jgi:hypothetical protein
LGQCGQLNLVRSRRRPAKLLASRSRPVSTSLSLAGHTNFSTAITSLCAVYRDHAALVAHQGVVMGRFTMPHRDAAPRLFLPASIRAAIGNPDSKRGLSRRFRGWPSADGHTALIEDFRLESSSPEPKLVSQRAADARCLNLGSHEPSLTPAHDEMIAQSTEQNGAGLCDAEQFTRSRGFNDPSAKPHGPAPIESSSLATLFSSYRERRRTDKPLHSEVCVQCPPSTQ